MNDQDPGNAELKEPDWKPLNRVQRRVAGVLVEKAKTTPDAYPLTLNAITTGCNQKSNRSPQMQLEPDDAQEALEQLREMGAVVEVLGGGRVSKFKHLLYEWLGVDKVEIAVMAELLLRGEQTLGELRGRAARMEPIADLGALRPVVASLVAKGLVVELTPEGRGQIISHALYEPVELERLKQECASGAKTAARPKTASGPASPAVAEEVDELRRELDQLREEVAGLRQRLDRLEG